MNIKFYNNSSPNNKITKELSFYAEYDTCVIKNVNDVVNPIIRIKVDTMDFNKFNYCYISEFDRYYFVTEKEVETNHTYVIYLKCDVLMSFKTYILSGYGELTQATKYDKYFNDGSYNTLVTKEYGRYDFSMKPVDFTKTSTVLVTIGGV